jgi:hypothetical protein
MNNISIVLLFFTFFLVFSCKEKEKEDLNEEETILYDSLKKIAFHDIRKRTDSICMNSTDSLFQTYVDSLMALRQNEIDALFNEN